MGRATVDLTNKRFGKLVAIRQLRSKKGATCWECLCDCGVKKIFLTSNLTGGGIVSCNCHRWKGKHRLTGTKEYRTWQHMKRRCEGSKKGKNGIYIKKGITVCKRWVNSFENFIQDMGKCPPNKNSLDRKNNALGYFPKNCRWANDEEQANNKDTNVYLTYKGITLSMQLWCKKLGLKYGTVRTRVRLGYDVERIFNQPVKQRMICLITDTREQKPLWINKGIRKGLCVGDYTTVFLLNKVHIERKSLSDMYQTIIHSHVRFRNELIKADTKNIKLPIFIEGTRESFTSLKFPGASRFNMKPETLKKIIDTMEHRYKLELNWFPSRESMKRALYKRLMKEENNIKLLTL